MTIAGPAARELLATLVSLDTSNPPARAHELSRPVEHPPSTT